MVRCTSRSPDFSESKRRVDVLDPALLRSGRLDRKIEFPLPNEEARANILQLWPFRSAIIPASTQTALS
jgi:AAA+ superfamily predicted ATPase